MAAPRLRAASVQPNILIITTDQQFADAASYRIGTRYLHTPGSTASRRTGTVFAQEPTAPIPLCVPSRTSMYTGRYPTETGVMDNDAAKSNRRQEVPMMGKIFEDAGYQTAYFGKWHIAFPCSTGDSRLR